MNYLYACVLVFFLLGNSFGQNLIKNGDFDDFVQLPFRHSQLEFSKFVYNPSSNKKASPDYFHVDGYHDSDDIKPYSGKGYCGIYTHTHYSYREYILLSLTDPLVIGLEYELQFALSNGVKKAANNYLTLPLASDAFDVLFLKNELSQNSQTPIVLAPTFSIDTVMYAENWIQFTFKYRAKGGEKYILLGNLKEGNDVKVAPLSGYDYGNFSTYHSYFFVDDVSLKLLSDFPLKGKTTYDICFGDTLDLIVSGDSLLTWQMQPTNQVLMRGSDTVLRVAPVNSVNYLVAGRTDSLEVNIHLKPNLRFRDTTVCIGKEWAYSIRPTSFDSISISPPLVNGIFDTPGNYEIAVWEDACFRSVNIQYDIEDCEVLLTFPNIITPNGDGKNELFKPIQMKGILWADLRIYNRWGKEVFASNDVEQTWVTSEVSEGVYYWNCDYVDRNSERHSMNGYVLVVY